MCTQPVTLRRDHRKERGFSSRSLEPLPQVRCGVCEQCRAEKLDNWKGRILAEAEDCENVSVVTLSYGRDDTGRIDYKQSRALEKRDVKKMWGRMRYHGLKFRYVVAGEYGDKNGRAHFHAIIFWRGTPPEMEKRNRRYMWKYWPHGFTYIDDCSGPAAHYVAKYVGKQEDKHGKKPSWSASALPPIGARFFERLALKYVDAGLSPCDGIYSPPGSEFVKPRNGQLRYQYRMHGAIKRVFVNAFVEGWMRKHPNEDWPPSPWLETAIIKCDEHVLRRFHERKSEQAAYFEQQLALTRTRAARLVEDRRAEREARLERERKAKGLNWPSEVERRETPRYAAGDTQPMTDADVAAAKAVLARRARDAYRAAAFDAERWRLAGDYPAIVGLEDPQLRPDTKLKGVKAVRARLGAVKPVYRYKPLEHGAYPLARMSGAKGGIGRPLREELIREKYQRDKAIAAARDTRTGKRI